MYHDYRRYEDFERLREILGDETIFSELSNYFSSDDFNGFVESLITDYDLESEFESEDNENDDEEDYN